MASAFAAALSCHPVSSHAAGEVVGQLLEQLGPAPDLLLILATPGHAGALEDIAATARALLSPATMLAAVTAGLGVGEQWIREGPGLAVWAGRCGPLRAVGPSDPWPSADSMSAAVSLTTGAGLPSALGPGGVRPPVLTATVAGPVVLDGGSPGPGPAGVAFAPGSGFDLVVVRGLRGLGPRLEVTRAERAMIYELDGRPALRQLVDLARDNVPVADLPALAAGLHIHVHATGATGTEWRPAPLDPLPVLGVDRANGAIAVAAAVRTGDLVQFAVPDPAALRAGLGRALAAGPAAAVVFATTPRGRHTGPATSAVDRPAWPGSAAPLPEATILCAVTPGGATGAHRSDPTVMTATVAHFPRSEQAG